ncbi:cryptochrome/photolyase family protein [Kiloniella sp. b19]|uniref:cryptochrome/photolyase family protein n=1 Tax=Kiloniella sp. GXU_MW_B19 TaxID=3141326 RepID=UPI0031E1FE3B
MEADRAATSAFPLRPAQRPGGYRSLILIMGDHLSHEISSLQQADPDRDLVMLCEVRDEATSVRHHKKKIAFLFSAMRHFALELRDRGFSVRYVTLDEPGNTGSFHGEVTRAIADFAPRALCLCEPSEYRVKSDVLSWEEEYSLPVTLLPDDRFLCSPQMFANWAADRKQLRLEYFYRDIRKRYDILMDGKSPLGGQWNYDSDNRKSAPENLSIPTPTVFEPDDITSEVFDLVTRHFADHFGDLHPFSLATTRKGALIVLQEFISQRLSLFGDFQDAMLEGEAWMFHSHISFYLNVGLLTPMECIRAAEDALHRDVAPLNAVEGFIRQIAGWREYVRGLYWLKMPDYKTLNHLDAKRELPDFFWTAQTDLNCLKQVITETGRNAYAHHIQRLMVVGNFSLLAGLHPDAVNEWFLIVYADAFEWVELPNVSGMALFADGGIMASKPYASSGQYIDRMSNYCKGCRYSVREKTGPEACPFNYLYWDFLIRNRDRLSANPRLGMPYRNLARMSGERQQALQEDAAAFLSKLGT